MALKRKARRRNISKVPLYTKLDFAREAEPTIRDEIGSEPYRSETRRDYARLIHSAAFRRLQGKTQMFPGWESDFFRNRLTHSLEVSQIAESLTHRINSTNDYFSGKNAIDPDITRFAGLVHDLGHPPFGHNGEKALDDAMKKGAGGFEGNAQTLRIICRLEKKEYRDKTQGPLLPDGTDNRLGLNLTYRSLAAALKYDKEIPSLRNPSGNLVKGYYQTEKELIKIIKKKVAPGFKGKFKTIECSIMDLADDIAYSTYDLEDSFKAGFLNPISVLSSPDPLLHRVAQEVNRRISTKMTSADVLSTLFDMFASLFDEKDIGQFNSTDPASISELVVYFATKSENYAQNGNLRTELTSDLISSFMAGVCVEVNERFPAMTKVFFEPETLRKVEVLKTFTYQATIMSPRLKVAEYRGYEVVEKIFKGLIKDDGYLLLPDDHRDLYLAIGDDAQKQRVICDFVAGMTDRYAVEFYSRLYGENPQSIFKPV